MPRRFELPWQSGMGWQNQKLYHQIPEICPLRISHTIWLNRGKVAPWPNCLVCSLGFGLGISGEVFDGRQHWLIGAVHRREASEGRKYCRPTASKRFNARALEAGRKCVVRTVSPTVSAGHFKPKRRFLAELDMLTTNLRAAETAK